MPSSFPPSEESTARKKSHVSSPIIEIVVGPASKSYNVDRSVLCSQSDYLTAACSERWLAEDGTIRLPEEDPVIFELLLNFLHKRSYLSALGMKRVGVVRPQFMLYVLADKYRVPRLVEGMNFWFGQKLYSPRNYAYSFANYVSDCEIRFVYENTSPSSELRRMVARSVVHEIAKKLIDLTIPGQGILQLCIELPVEWGNLGWFKLGLAPFIATGFSYSVIWHQLRILHQLKYSLFHRL